MLILFGLWVIVQPVELVSRGVEKRELPKLKSMVCLSQAVVVVPEGAPSEVVEDTTVIYDAEVVEVRCDGQQVRQKGEDVTTKTERRR
jgi:hypothetical protein